MAIVSISRDAFSEGQTLAGDIAAGLTYRCLGEEVIVKAAQQYNIDKEKLAEAVNEHLGIIKRWRSEKERYLTCLRAALIGELKDDNAVYGGNGGQFLLWGLPTLLSVRVVADMGTRIRSLTKIHNLSKEEALRFIKIVDTKQSILAKPFRHFRRSNPKDYALPDLIINLEHIHPDDACNIVCKTATMAQYETTDETRKLMNDLALSSHLEALIANTKSISGNKNVRIATDEGVVTIDGMVGSLLDADRVRTLVRETPGVKDINSRIRVRLWGVPTTELARV